VAHGDAGQACREGQQEASALHGGTVELLFLAVGDRSTDAPEPFGALWDDSVL
jgi:hypothetical protein